MLARFLAVQVDPAAASARLDADEAHHLTHVLRLRPGDEIAVFDGAGREFRARIDRAGRSGADLTLLEEIPAAAEARVRMIVGQALLKADKLDAVVRDATMLGVAAIEPLLTANAIVQKRAPGRDRAVHRWQRIAVASSKQARRAVVPSIGGPTEFREWIRAHRSDREPSG